MHTRARSHTRMNAVAQYLARTPRTELRWRVCVQARIHARTYLQGLHFVQANALTRTHAHSARPGVGLAVRSWLKSRHWRPSLACRFDYLSLCSPSTSTSTSLPLSLSLVSLYLSRLRVTPNGASIVTRDVLDGISAAASNAAATVTAAALAACNALTNLHPIVSEYDILRILLMSLTPAIQVRRNPVEFPEAS